MKEFVYLFLMLVGICIFGVYVWFIVNYTMLSGGYAVGILFFATVVFTSGIVNYYEVTKNKKR